MTHNARFRLRIWHVPAAILAVLLIGVIVWMLPRRVNETVSVDGRHRYGSSDAPPRRDVIWQPAESLPAGPRGVGPEDSIVRPQLADGGVSLYYTVQRTGSSADIYRSQFDGRKWLPGEAVEVLNTAADDFGPVISADGEELYLYSDRPGGFGGFDVYVSRRTADGWSPPENVGPGLNTPANEYDPAVSPDGRELYFSSNRTEKMQEQLELATEDGEDPAKITWKATLRAQPGLQQYDLYVAHRGKDSTAWEEIRPLDLANTSAANEGEPYVSPDGAFLYFASDRANEHGGAANYDLYRARRMPGGVVRVENLGAGVNSAANEHDPALSLEGFRIVFSSDRNLGPKSDETSELAKVEHYALYQSLATEVYDEAGWDVSHVPPLGTIIWWLVTALLLAALLAALIWYIREVSLRRAPVPVFLLLALLLHLLLAGGAFLVPIDGLTLAERITRQFDKIVAQEVQLESSPKTQQSNEKAYERVADLKSVDTVKIADAPRQSTQSPNMPVPTQSPSPSVPRQLDRQSLPERVAIASPDVTPIDKPDPKLNRRDSIVEKLLTEDLVQINPIESPADAPADSAIAKTDVNINKTQTQTPTPSPLARRPVNLDSAMSREPIDAQRPDTPSDSPTSQPQSKPIERVATADIAPLENAKIATDSISPSPDATADSSQPDTVKPTVERTSSAAQTPAPKMPRAQVANGYSSPVRPAAVDAPQPIELNTPSTPDTARASSLPRRDRVAMVDSPAPERIAIEATDSSASNPGTIASSPQVKINVTREAVGGAVLQPTSPPSVAAGGARSSTAEQALEAVELPASAPSTAAAGVNAVAELFRRQSVERVEIAGAEAIAANVDATNAPANPSDAAEDVRGEKVDADRSSDAAGSLAARPLEGLSGGASQPSKSRFDSIAEAVRAESAGAPADVGVGQKSLELARAQTGAFADGVADAVIATDTIGDSASGSLPAKEAAAVDGADVDVARADGVAELAVDVPVPAAFGGRYDPRRDDLSIGALAKVDFAGDPSFSPVAASIDRLPAHAPLAMFAQDKIGLEAMLRLRVGDDNTKQDLIDSFGGKKETLVAIERGLAWMASVQHEDGRWDLKDFPKAANGQRSNGHGSSQSDSAATGLGLLPFLGDGHTHQGGQYQQVVARGLEWLVDNQKDDGDLFTGGEGNAHMYSHGIAAIALCEAYGMTKDEALREPAQRAINFIVKAQHGAGGWRYRPGDKGDTSVVGWQVMALKSGQMAGLTVPEDTLNKARRYINDARANDNAQYGYQGRGGGKPAMTAEGLLCYAYLGAKRDDPNLLRGVDWIAQRVPAKGKDTSYYWYYGTQALFHVQGEPWRNWNDAMSSTVLSTQAEGGPNAGSWDPKDEWEQRGGRIMSTSLRLLMLEVYFRHLPLYQALE